MAKNAFHFSAFVAIAILALLLVGFSLFSLRSPAGRLFGSSGEEGPTALAAPDRGCLAGATTDVGTCACIATSSSAKCTTTDGGSKSWCTDDPGDPGDTYHCQKHGDACRCHTVKVWKDEKRKVLDVNPPGGW